MSNRLELCAYWGPRRESIDECADRLLAFMRDLTRCDEAFSQWYERGWSRKDALKRKVDVHDRDRLVGLLEKGRNRGDFDKSVIEDLGFHIGMWNGGDSDKEVGFSITCGLYSEIVGVGSNNVVLLFPKDPGALVDPERASHALAVVVKHWAPDWGVILSNEARNVRDWWQKPFVDWMVYVSQRVASVPSPSTVTHLENGGSLIVVQPSPPRVDDPDAQERIRRIEKIVRP